MKRLRVLAFAALVLVLALGGLGPRLDAQGKQEKKQDKKQPKKKARKVWTNDDLKALKSNPISVVGRAPAPAAASASPSATEEASPYADMPMEEREQRIADLELELAQGEETMSILRDQRYSARTDEERDAVTAKISKLEQGLDDLRAEIELIRNTPPPKPAKPAAGTKPAAPQAETPPPS